MKKKNLNEDTNLTLIAKQLKAIENNIKFNEVKIFKNKNNNISKFDILAKLSIMLSVVADIGAGILVGVVIGKCCDNYFNTTPLFFIISTIIGAGAGFYNLYIRIIKNK